VRVEPGEDARVDARVTSVGWRIAPEAVTITESQNGDRIDIEVRLPRSVFSISTGRSLAIARQERQLLAP